MTSLRIEREKEATIGFLKERLNRPDYSYIFIAGPTCSGKTTLSYLVEQFFWEKNISVTVIREDDYFKNIENIPRGPRGFLTDCTDAFHIEELKRDFKNYLENGKAALPMYDVATNKRLPSKQYVLKNDVTIVEGLHVISLFSEIKNSIFIYADTSIDICLKRRINRDYLKFRIPEQRIIQHFNECIMPSYEKEILPQRNMHDVILYDSARGD